jgi:hypothetical protein
MVLLRSTGLPLVQPFFVQYVFLRIRSHMFVPILSSLGGVVDGNTLRQFFLFSVLRM